MLTTNTCKKLFKLILMQILQWNFIILLLKYQKTVAFLASSRIQTLRQRVMLFLSSGFSNPYTQTLAFISLTPKYFGLFYLHF